MSKTILQTANVSNALGFIAVNNNSCNTTYYSMAYYDRAQVVIGQLSGITGSILAVEMRQSTTSNAINSKVVSTVTNAAITSYNGIGKVEVRGDQLDVANSFYYVGARVYETNTLACNVAGIVIRTPSRYPQATLPA